MTVVGLPSRAPGRPTAASDEQHRAQVAAFAGRILKLQSAFEFAPSSRGWAYVLESDGVIDKGAFDSAQRIINECRKDGTLPLDICAEDGRRGTDGVESLDGDIDDELGSWVQALAAASERYTPISFWDVQACYVELAVEKVDLKHLFAPVCRPFRIPVTNVAGWADLHCRAAMMRRFAEHERAGRTPVLLYCGDHDPGGLNISDCLRRNLEEMAGATGWHPANLIIDRFGLDYEFITELGLSWIENLETSSGRRLNDPKHPDNRKAYVQDYIRRFGVRKVEANALIVRPAEGRALCRRAILKYLPETAPQEHENRLGLHRVVLRHALAERFALTGEREP